MSAIDELRKNVGNKNIIVGTDRTVDALKAGKVSRVFITKNCPVHVKKEIVRLSAIEKVEITDIDLSNDELGTLFKKPFSISVVCYIKE